MHPSLWHGQTRLLFWQRVREFAVPPSMIETAAARRAVGDWAGACAAARVDTDLDLRAAGRRYGGELAAQVRADLRHLAPDLLRWHVPRIAPDGLLRPGLTIGLARYHPAGTDTVHLVARTPPAWADAGQRISIGLWDPSYSREHPHPHPHPRPDRRFRLDLHRHLWDTRRAGDLRERAGHGGRVEPVDPDGLVPPGIDCAVDRWASEAAILLQAYGREEGTVALRVAGQGLLLRVGAPGGAPRVAVPRGGGSTLPVLPDAATWVLPDLALLRARLIDIDQLHPLVAAALVPGRVPACARPPDAAGPRLVACRGAEHRIGLVDGVLVALDHEAAEIRRETLLAALGGPPLPCLRAIDDANRHPESLVEIRARLDHGDAVGALAAVEALLGPDALLRGGALHDELRTAAVGRVTHGLYRAGMAAVGPAWTVPSKPRRTGRSRTRQGF